MITRFKNRGIDYSKKVDIYRNLNRAGKVYSIRQEGKVVAHTTSARLTECNFVINRAGKKKALKTNVRNVHALIRGFLDRDSENTSSLETTVKYYPFVEKGFTVTEDEKVTEIHNSDIVVINSEGVSCSG